MGNGRARVPNAEPTTPTEAMYQGYSADAAHVTLRDESGNAVTVHDVSGTLQTMTVTLTTAAPTTRLTFNPPINGARIEVRAGAAAIDQDEALLYCVDAPNTTIAADWLDETLVGPRVCVKPDDGIHEEAYSSQVTYMDLKAIGTTIDIDVTVMGVV